MREPPTELRTMSKQVECFFDVVSPAAYLAWTQLPGIAAETGAEIVWRPMLLGGLFKLTGNSPPLAVPAKGRYTLRDFGRYAERYGVPFRLNPNFPINTVMVMRGAEAYRGTDRFDAYLRAMFEAMWVDARKLDDPEEVGEVLRSAGFDPAEVAELVQQPEIKQKLKASTDEAAERGAFGSPTFFVGDEMWFGQDRLDWVRDALRG